MRLLTKYLAQGQVVVTQYTCHTVASVSRCTIDFDSLLSLCRDNRVGSILRHFLATAATNMGNGEWEMGNGIDDGYSTHGTCMTETLHHKYVISK